MSTPHATHFLKVVFTGIYIAEYLFVVLSVSIEMHILQG